jgi:hypothetical protein
MRAAPYQDGVDGPPQQRISEQSGAAAVERLPVRWIGERADRRQLGGEPPDRLLDHGSFGLVAALRTRPQGKGECEAADG